MASTPTPTPNLNFSSSREAENLGILFAGFVTSSLLYGGTIFQTYAYYARFPQDSNRIRCFVILLAIVDTITSASVSAALYHFLIDLYAIPVDVLVAPPSMCVQYALSFVIVFVSQLFFAFRVFEVSSGSHLVSLSVVSLSFVSFVFGMTSAGQMFQQRQLDSFALPAMKAIATTHLSFAVLADVLIFLTLCYWLRPQHYPYMRIPKRFIDRVNVLIVNRGLSFTLVQVAYLCAFVAVPSHQYWVMFQMIGSKVYVNSVFQLLNCRESENGRGVQEEEYYQPPGATKTPAFGAPLPATRVYTMTGSSGTGATHTTEGTPKSVEGSQTASVPISVSTNRYSHHPIQSPMTDKIIDLAAADGELESGIVDPVPDRLGRVADDGDDPSQYIDVIYCPLAE
ncbi:hypothetical protein BKA82DRAFT_888122 [Pisolithus tinctorius]|uniref:DUF6534 domain-containing protein n=1 Tax=Pisolithus tinctorius Marx 270 TaxID=870435 RepID=A0A0C3NQX6_PISTI|nr:hypothetical protein BKA82DRAFT_888122 [Pisolithus tinctorius]KIN97718.1 hypothetical protein M404DRAFT_888122 [Pisolithus tinctorius Marx 270]